MFLGYQWAKVCETFLIFKMFFLLRALNWRRSANIQFANFKIDFLGNQSEYRKSLTHFCSVSPTDWHCAFCLVVRASRKAGNRPFAAIDHVVNFPVATRLWWASESDIPWQQYRLRKEAWLFQDYILIVFTVDLQLGTLFFVLSLRLVFIYHWKKSCFEADLSYDRSHRLSNGRDRRANVRALAAFIGMLLNFNISNLFKLWRFLILDVVWYVPHTII